MHTMRRRFIGAGYPFFRHRYAILRVLLAEPGADIPPFPLADTTQIPNSRGMGRYPVNPDGHLLARMKLGPGCFIRHGCSPPRLVRSPDARGTALACSGRVLCCLSY